MLARFWNWLLRRRRLAAPEYDRRQWHEIWKDQLRRGFR